MNLSEIQSIPTQSIHADWLEQAGITLNVLRLDTVHPVVSGNKWFKLKYFLEEALLLQKQTIATFGGAWSNHIVATAYACNIKGLSSIGIIRGDETAMRSETLSNAAQNGMKCIFVSRDKYRSKQDIMQDHNGANWYWVPEGGHGSIGARGAAEILQLLPRRKEYTHIIAAVGTGTTLAGLINSAQSHQTVIGISSMKNNLQLNDEVSTLTEAASAPFNIIHDYHFGGYGKHPPELIEFMNETYHQHQLPLDIVYTSKTFYAIKDLTKKNHFNSGSKLVMIHTGGLQGNQSLPAQVLAF
jgi:1-aminocyclopropane-1-carboxylate deaminase